MMKPRIGILHYSCYPIIGGVEKVIEAHAKLFFTYGYNVTVIVGEGKKFHPKIKVKVIPEMRSSDKVNKIINKELNNNIIGSKFRNRVTILYKKLKWALKKINVVFIHNILTMHFNIPLIIALKKIIKEDNKRKYIVWCHDLAFSDNIKNQFFLNLLTEKIDGVKYVCISEFGKKQISNLFKLNKKDIVVIPNGIYFDFLGLNKLTIEIFNHFDLFNQDLVLLTPARVVRRKNLELGIKIVKELNKTKKTKLIITGPPDLHNPDSHFYYNYLINLVNNLNLNNKIIFLYKFRKNKRNIKIDNTIIRDLFLLCDMLLLPSKQEGFGIPILEAGLTNTPIACSKISSFKEIGKNNVLFFDINDPPDKIARNIIKYCNKNSTTRMFKDIIRNYLWDNIFKTKIEPLLN